MRTRFVLAALALLAPSACGGPSSPPPEEPDPEASRAAFTRGNSTPAGPTEGKDFSDEASPAPSAQEEEPAPSAAPPPPPEPEPEPEPAKLSKPPRDILTAPLVAFMINYPSSAPKEAAAEQCTKDSGEDLAARAKCMSDARAKFVADVVLFKQEQGTWYWYVYRRDRGTLFEVQRTPVTFADDTERTIKLKPSGKEAGGRVLFAGAKEILITLVTEYQLELEDPKLGKLVYEAKIGLVGN